MIYLKQNIFSADREIVRENCNILFSLNKQKELPRLNIMVYLIEQNLVTMILVVFVKIDGKHLIITLSLTNLKTEIFIVN